MIRTVIARSSRLVCTAPARCFMKKNQLTPEYDVPAEGDAEKDRLFDEEFGIKEAVPDLGPVSRFENAAKRFDGYYKMTRRISKFFGDNLYYKVSEDEKLERSVLTDRLQEFYETIPQSYPDSQWWNDVIDHYVRYNDYEGALTMWSWLVEHQLDVDQQILDKFDRFFYENDPTGLFTKGLTARLREEQEYIPRKGDVDKINNNPLRVGEHGIMV